MPFTAIVLAAGEGTRMKSRHPKVMHKVLDKPLVWWPVTAARKAGASRIVVIIGNGAQEVKDFFAQEETSTDTTPVEFVEQSSPATPRSSNLKLFSPSSRRPKQSTMRAQC